MVNVLFIGLFMFVLFMFLYINPTRRLAIPYVMPGTLFFILFAETALYSVFKNGNIKQWASIFFGGAFKNARYAILGAIIVGGFLMVSYSSLNRMNLFIYFMDMIIALIAFYAVFYFFPTKGGKSVYNAYNLVHLYGIKRDFVSNEKYYG